MENEPGPFIRSLVLIQTTMVRFEVKQTSKLQLTSYPEVALIGQCCQAAQLEAVIDLRAPVFQGMRTSDIVKSVVGLLSQAPSLMRSLQWKMSQAPFILLWSRSSKRASRTGSRNIPMA